MTRVDYHVSVSADEEPMPIHEEIRYAMNSGIRASEAAVRSAARAAGVVFVGDKPQRDGGVYTRVWREEHGPGVIRVKVEREP